MHFCFRFTAEKAINFTFFLIFLISHFNNYLISLLFFFSGFCGDQIVFALPSSFSEFFCTFSSEKASPIVSLWIPYLLPSRTFSSGDLLSVEDAFAVIHIYRLLSYEFPSQLCPLKSERESQKAAFHCTHLLNPGIIFMSFMPPAHSSMVKRVLGGDHLDLYPSGLALCAHLSISAHCGFISECLYLLKFFSSCKETFLELSS